MTKFQKLSAVTLAFTLLVTACGSADEEPDEQAEDVEPATEAPEESPEDSAGSDETAESADDDGLADLVAAAEEEGSINWWTGMPTGMAEEVAAAFSDEYDIDVVIERQAANSLYERFTTEYDAGTRNADVFNVLNVPMVDDLKDRGWLEPIPAEYVEGWDEQFVSDTLHWISVRIDPVVVSYNTDLVSADDLDDSWETLHDQELGALGLVDPRTNNGGYIWYFGLRDGLGYDSSYFEGLRTQELTWFPETTAGTNALASGQIAVLGNNLESRVLGFIEDGAPVANHYPSEGLPIAIDAMGIVAEGPNPSAAKLFLHFISSAEGSQIVADASKTFSANPNVTPADPAGDRPALADLVQAPIDWGRFFSETDDWREEMFSIFGRA